jgi:hypothetical protein
MLCFHAENACARTPVRDRIVTARRPDEGLANLIMSKKTCVTCNDCYFRNAGLCALPGNEVCPTFRLARAGSLEPPRQPVLVPRGLVPAHAAA